MSTKYKKGTGFLVLTLHNRQGLQIGDDIFISVNKFKKHGEVSLGIRAPRNMRVVIVKESSTKKDSEHTDDKQDTQKDKK